VSEHSRVRVEVVDDDAIGLVTLSDPDHRNALSLEMTRDLADAVGQVLDLGVGALVLAADPPVFCAGGSLDDLLTPRAPLAEMYAGFLALANAPVVTIAAVGGAAVGAGVNLPLACDVILASPEARFDPRFLDVGIHPGGGHLWRLEQRLGRQAAAALSLCGESLNGEEAERKGLAWRCVPGDQLLETALGMARRVASRPGDVVRRAKATLDASLAIDNSAEAIALELEAQQWSMDQPEFTARVRALRARLDRSQD
jgi:enoyl-CoA hydratase